MKITLILFLGLLFIACNPSRRIVLKNNSGDPASFYWIMKDRDSLWRSPFFVASTDSSGVTLQSATPKNNAEMSFGFGSWTPDFLRDAVKDVKSMHFKWKNGVVDLNSSEQIMNYLLAHRRGLDKHRIVIEFK